MTDEVREAIYRVGLGGMGFLIGGILLFLLSRLKDSEDISIGILAVLLFVLCIVMPIVALVVWVSA